VFDEEFGGFQPSSEAPGFGDQELTASAANDEVDPGDAVASNIETEVATHPTGYHVFALRVLWGQLRFDSTSTTPTDWDGGLTITDGRIGVKRLIRFEPATDYLKPRSDANAVLWASRTTVHNDGILVLIGVPNRIHADTMRHDSTVVDTLPDPLDNVVSFRTGPLSLSFTLRELAALDTVISVDDFGNAVMFNGALVRPDNCPKGFLGGHWARNDAGTGGEFKGRWVSQNGDHVGYLMGRYGINSNGRRVFFGKFIAADGRFEGFIRGVWHPADLAGRGGAFKGVFYGPAGDPVGRLYGRFKAEEPGKGVFQGVWKTKCAHWDRCALGWERWDDEGFDDSHISDGEMDDVAGGA
jgi:hypothetical protein